MMHLVISQISLVGADIVQGNVRNRPRVIDGGEDDWKVTGG